MTRKLIFEQLKNTSIEQIKAYLLSTGWVLDGMIGCIGTIWHREEISNSDAELLLPETNEIKDYEERIADVVEQLSVFQRTSLEDVTRAIVTYLCDLISVRVVHADVEGGTIPLDDGVLLFQRVRDLMSAATLSTISKRKHFSGNRPPEASDFLGSLKLGQTEVGSYIVNVIAPVGHVISATQSENSIDETSMGRMVTANLAAGLQALHTAIDQYSETQELSVFESAVEKGVSINMCEALIGLSGEKKNRGFSISIAPSSQQKLGLDMIKQHFFDANSISGIERAVEYYKENYVLLGFNITGFVKKLTREPSDENGIVIVAATVHGVEKNVSIELIGDEYREAIHAHENKQVVSCSGDLHVSARSAKLLNSQNFKIMGNEKLF